MRSVGILAVGVVHGHFYLIGRNVVNFEDPDDGQNVVNNCAYSQEEDGPYGVVFEAMKAILGFLDLRGEHGQENKEDVHRDSNQTDDNHNRVFSVQSI